MKSLHFRPIKCSSFIMVLLFILATLKSVAQDRCAIPVTELTVYKQQPNGRKITLKQSGNPFLHYYETLDGFTVIKDAKDDYFKYAIHGSNGNLKPDNFIVRNLSDRTTKEVVMLDKKSKHLRYQGKELQRRTQEAKNFKSPLQTSMKTDAGDANEIAMSPPVTSGTFKHLVLLIDYPDYAFKHDNPAFSELMNTIGYSENGQAGSFKDYYLDTSYGNLDVQTTVAGWYTAKHNMDYYGYNPDKPFPYNARELVREAVDAAEAAGIDFSQFDNDGDGSCDLVTIAHAGSGAETIGVETKYIWSHKASLDNLKVVHDGVLINNYTMNPELNGGEASTTLSDIGIYVHEFGHALGLPDLYDFTTSNGAGKWCAMSWSSNQRTPIEFNPWFKQKLGWMSPTILNGSGTISNMGNTFDTSTYYRINTSDPQEFFMLANMQKTKWHTRIPSSGLMIWHIDTGSSNNANVSRLHVVPEQADGLQHLQEPFPAGNQWDRGDPYPGITNNTSFNATSNPTSNTNDGVAVAMAISNIAELDGLISFDFSDGTDRENQSVTFETIEDKVYGAIDFQLSASASSDLPVTFSVVEGPITITDNRVAINGGGLVTIAADQYGNDLYHPATQIRRSFIVAKSEQIITIDAISDKLTTDLPFSISAFINTNLELTYEISGPATISDNIITLTGSTGVVTLNILQIGTANYLPVSKSINFNVTELEKLNQQISFDVIGDKIYGEPAFQLNATSSVGLPITYTIDEGSIAITSDMVEILGAGSVTIKASQPGNEIFNAAEDVTILFNIAKAAQTITIDDIEDKFITDVPFEIVAAANSQLPLNFQIEGPASISETTITIDGQIGEVNIKVWQDGDNNYHSSENQIKFNVFEASDTFDIELHPNPTSGVFRLESAKQLWIRVYNIAGKSLLTKEIKSGTVDISKFSNGIYIIEAIDMNGNIVRKKIIKN